MSKCVKCGKLLNDMENKLPPLTDIGKLCVKCINKMADEIRKQRGHDDPFGNLDNHKALLIDFVVHMAEFQVRHRLDFNALMTFPDVFMTVIKLGDSRLLKIYAKTLHENGITVEGKDI